MLAVLLKTEYFSANLRTERPLPPLLSLINKILVSIRVALWVNKWMSDQFFLFRHIFYLSRLFLFLFCFWLVHSPCVLFWLVCFISAWFLLYIFQYYSLSILLSFRHIHHINQINARITIQIWLNEKCMVNLDEFPLWRGYLLWRDQQKVCTVQNTEVSTFERFISSKNSLKGPGGVHIGRLYCSFVEKCSKEDKNCKIRAA